MPQNSLQKATQIISTELLELVRSIMLETDGMSKTGSSFADLLRVKSEQTSDSIIVSLYVENYIAYAEQKKSLASADRQSVDSLRDWAINSGIDADNETLYTIAQSIWFDSIALRPILAKIEERIDQAFDSRWADLLFEALIDDLTKYFNQ